MKGGRCVKVLFYTQEEGLLPPGRGVLWSLHADELWLGEG